MVLTCSDALKIGLISMDSTMRSNLGVGMPIDILVARRDVCDAELSLPGGSSPANLIFTICGNDGPPRSAPPITPSRARPMPAGVELLRAVNHKIGKCGRTRLAAYLRIAGK